MNAFVNAYVTCWTTKHLSPPPCLRVLGSAHHSAADRTSDRAGAAREKALDYLRITGLHKELRGLSVKPQWHVRFRPFAPIRGQEPQLERGRLPRLFRSGPRPSPSPR